MPRQVLVVAGAQEVPHRPLSTPCGQAGAQTVEPVGSCPERNGEGGSGLGGRTKAVPKRGLEVGIKNY